MKKLPVWIPATVFLAVSVPTVLVLQELSWGGDYRLLIAMVAGAAATGLVQSLLGRRKEEAAS